MGAVFATFHSDPERSMTNEELKEQALKMPARDRAELASLLFQSISTSGTDIEEDGIEETADRTTDEDSTLIDSQGGDDFTIE